MSSNGQYTSNGQHTSNGQLNGFVPRAEDLNSDDNQISAIRSLSIEDTDLDDDQAPPLRDYRRRAAFNPGATEFLSLAQRRDAEIPLPSRERIEREYQVEEEGRGEEVPRRLMSLANRPPQPLDVRSLRDIQDVPQRGVRLDSPIKISCHCGRVRFSINTLPLSVFGPGNKIQVDLCHTARARKSSGQLVTSYFPILTPEEYILPLTSQMNFRNAGEDILGTLFFCPICGCHVLRRSYGMVPGIFPGFQVLGIVWGVATGTATMDLETGWKFTIGRHRGVCETGDGGLSIWMRKRKDQSPILTDLPEQNPNVPRTGYMRWFSPNVPLYPTFVNRARESLRASCACSRIRFHITRPSVRSYLPKSPYPDLMVPYLLDPSQPNTSVWNPLDEKWWIRPPRVIGHGGPDNGHNPDERQKRYLAGNCACTSCRKSSGFEIQSWAFIPRCNVYMHLFDGTTHELDFNTLPRGLLGSYASSRGMQREFCPTCGATVFWHNTDRPELIDVSVGLLNGRGVRAEDWLEWWEDRVSFAEMTRDSHGGWLWDPVTSLETGLADAVNETNIMHDMLRRGLIGNGGAGEVVR